jgi:hypothetical protein
MGEIGNKVEPVSSGMAHGLLSSVRIPIHQRMAAAWTPIQ